MMVLEFSCQDGSAFTALGKNCKEVRWRVAAMGSEPMEIKLSIEKLPVGSPTVGITYNSNKLFPLGGSKTKDKLKTDFEQKWPFRGQARNIEKRNFFEVKPKTMGDEWFPALSIAQRRDGTFEGTVWLPDGNGGFKTVYMPTIDKADIREQDSKRALQIAERFLLLNVPSASPLKESTLTLLDETQGCLITHFFARCTPPARGSLPESLPAPNDIFMEVNKERTQVTSQATHSTLVEYLAAELRSISCNPESKTKISWRFMIGPFAEHTVTLEKRYKSSRIATLVVDGKVLIESAAADFDCNWEAEEEGESQSPSMAEEGGPWACKFRFIGERSVKFKVFEVSKDGLTLETTDLLEGLEREQIKYTKVCTVSAMNPRDLKTATLEIDGVSFHEMREKASFAEESIACDPDVLRLQYGLAVPVKVRDEPPKGLAALQGKLKEAGQQMQESWEKATPQLQALSSRVGETFGSMFKPPV